MHGDASWIEVRLVADGDGRTRLTLIHTAIVSPFSDPFCPGAVGVGRELGLVGLNVHLGDPDAPRTDEEALAKAPEGRAFMEVIHAEFGITQAAVSQHLKV